MINYPLQLKIMVKKKLEKIQKKIEKIQQNCDEVDELVEGIREDIHDDNFKEDETQDLFDANYKK